jgi:hypothetical protein
MYINQLSETMSISDETTGKPMICVRGRHGMQMLSSGAAVLIPLSKPHTSLVGS